MLFVNTYLQGKNATFSLLKTEEKYLL